MAIRLMSHPRNPQTMTHEIEGLIAALREGAVALEGEATRWLNGGHEKGEEAAARRAAKDNDRKAEILRAHADQLSASKRPEPVSIDLGHSCEGGRTCTLPNQYCRFPDCEKGRPGTPKRV